MAASDVLFSICGTNWFQACHGWTYPSVSREAKPPTSSIPRCTRFNQWALHACIAGHAGAICFMISKCQTGFWEQDRVQRCLFSCPFPKPRNFKMHWKSQKSHPEFHPNGNGLPTLSPTVSKSDATLSFGKTAAKPQADKQHGVQCLVFPETKNGGLKWSLYDWVYCLNKVPSLFFTPNWGFSSRPASKRAASMAGSGDTCR